MLPELFTYLTTPCPPYVRKMGYLREAIGLKCRYKRHPARWQPHLERTRQCILSAAGKCGNRGKVVVLGSGFLLDVPLDELSAMFRDVVLIDIVCLPEIRRRIKRYGNVRFLLGDVTGIAETLYKNVSCGRRELPFAAPVLPEIDKDTGLVISLNVLSQLVVVPRIYALKKLPEIDQDRVASWCRRIIEAHYAFLASMTCNVCLIADYRYSKHDGSGRITRKVLHCMECPCRRLMIPGVGYSPNGRSPGVFKTSGGGRLAGEIMVTNRRIQDETFMSHCSQRRMKIFIFRQQTPFSSESYRRRGRLLSPLAGIHKCGFPAGFCLPVYWVFDSLSISKGKFTLAFLIILL